MTDGVIQLATLNVLSASLFEHDHYTLDGGDDLSTMDVLFRGRRVCMVGAIIPLLRRLKELQPAEVELRSEDLPGKPLSRIPCIRCGKTIMDGREVRRGEQVLCPSCAQTIDYYRIVR